MKRTTKKSLALLSTAAFALSMLAGCSGGSSGSSAGSDAATADTASESTAASETDATADGPLFSDPVEISMLIPSHASWPFQDDWYVIDMINEETNVDFKITSVDTEGFSEKLNLTMSSGELPDLIYLIGNAAVQQYAPQGAFVNILDHLDEMPNFKAWYEENQAYALNFMSADGGPLPVP